MTWPSEFQSVCIKSIGLLVSWPPFGHAFIGSARPLKATWKLATHRRPCLRLEQRERGVLRCWERTGQTPTIFFHFC